jgi:hypothetical protein
MLDLRSVITRRWHAAAKIASAESRENVIARP